MPEFCGLVILRGMSLQKATFSLEAFENLDFKIINVKMHDHDGKREVTALNR